MKINLKKEEFSLFNVLIIGDTCIDEFVYGTAVRLAPEAPVPVFNPVFEEANDGMAGNVVANLKTLGLKTFFIHNTESVIKTRYVDDRSGQILLRVDKNDSVTQIDSRIIPKIVGNQFEGVKIEVGVCENYS